VQIHFLGDFDGDSVFHNFLMTIDFPIIFSRILNCIGLSSYKKIKKCFPVLYSRTSSFYGLN